MGFCQDFLVNLFQAGASSRRQIGLEIERFGIHSSGVPLTYQNRGEISGACDLLRELGTSPEWQPQLGEKGTPIGLKTPIGKVSLEPGSQLEFSANPFDSLFQVAETVAEFEKRVNNVSQPYGFSWFGLGVHPFASLEDTDLISSQRYEIMDAYFPSVGLLGKWMMRLTTSVQINLDYSSEAEAMQMLRVGFLLAPFSYALFGNASLVRGALSGFQSYRGYIWQHTDPVRSGFIARALANDFSFAEYTEHLCKTPLMFAQNQKGSFVSAQKKSLSQIEKGELAGVVADEANAWNAIRELFTEARLKPGYVEIRSLDGQSKSDRYAAVAFWTGIMYSQQAREAVSELLRDFTPAVLEEFHHQVLRSGLQAQWAGKLAREMGEALFEISKKGLLERKLGEEFFLRPLQQILTCGTNPAQEVSTLYFSECKQDRQAFLERLIEREQ